MSKPASGPSVLIWAFLALAAGCLVGWIDLTATAVQGPALLLMLASFALTVPGRVSPVLVAVLCGSGIPLVHLVVQRSDWTPMLFLALAPAILGAGAGQFLSPLLQKLSPRLEVSLAVIAAAGVAPLALLLRSVGHPAPLWVAAIWQILTFVGWVIVAPRVALPRGAAIVAAGSVAHAAALIVVTLALLIPVRPNAAGMFAVALAVCLPLDLLAYWLARPEKGDATL